MTNLLVKIAALLPLATIALTANPALAQDFAAKSVQVSYAGLDLSNPAGQAELDRRIAHAINVVCNGNETSPLALRGEIRKCRTIARQNAMAKRQVVVAAAMERRNQLASR